MVGGISPELPGFERELPDNDVVISARFRSTPQVTGKSLAEQGKA
jgi:hypothetical protein